MTLDQLDRWCPAAPQWDIDWAGLDGAFEWIRAMRGCQQNPEFHAEGDVWVHTELVCRALAADPAWRELPAQDRVILFWAALLHDVGKPVRTQTGPDGITSSGDSATGARMARVILWRLGAPLEIREKICGLVRFHQVPFWLGEDRQGAFRARSMACTIRCDHLAMLTRADARGRECQDQDELLVRIALFEEKCQEAGCLSGPFAFPSDHGRFEYFRRVDRSPYYRPYEEPEFEVVMLAGLPAAGKNHWLCGQETRLPVVSLDQIRLDLGIKASEGPGAVVKAASEQAREFLRRKEPFVWNATNLSWKLRRQTVDLLADYGARIKIVYLEASEAVLQARNSGREHPVPAAAIERMLRRWDMPDITEAHQVEIVLT